MGKKIIKEKSHEALLIKSSCLERLSGCWEQGNKDAACLWKFVNAKKLSEQAAALKEIGQLLAGKSDVVPVLQLLSDAYLTCPPKHQMKRALASCLENSSAVKTEVAEVLTEAVRTKISDTGSDSPASRRATIDILNSLLENFPLGEICLQNILKDVLVFLKDSLGTFHSMTREATTPVALTEAMHHCHTTVQVWNKLVSRGENSADRVTTDIDSVLKAFIPIVWAILMTDSFLTDSRAACGMTLSLYFKVAPGKDDIQSSILELFPEYDLPTLSYKEHQCKESLLQHPALTRETKLAWPTARICVIGGALAMWDTHTLVSQLKPQHSLIVDVIGAELLDLIDKVHDTNSKVLLSRTLVLWTGKAISVLEECTPSSESQLEASLHGKAGVPSRFLDYAWNHWEDAIDVIRHQARLIFDNLLQCHLLASRETPSESEFLLGLFNSLIDGGWQNQGRYGPLCCLVGHLGAGVILKRTPHLPQHLLDTVADQALAGYVSELYEKMFTEHWQEVSLSAENPQDVTSWFVTWVDPLIQRLCTGNKLQKTHIIEYILPKLLKYNGDSLEYMTSRLTEDNSGVSTIGALVTCLKRAKMIGLLRKSSQPDLLTSDDSTDTLWNGVVSLPLLKQALCHQNEQIRLDAFGLLCENPKTTEVLSDSEIELIRFFLPLNLSSQSPAFRQHLTALLKKLYIRLRDGAQALRRKMKNKDVNSAADLTRYQDFVDWKLGVLFRNLYLGASFPRRTSSLSALHTFTHILTEGQSEFCLSRYMTAEREQTLLECLNDSFEQNKAEAFHILASLPPSSLSLKCPARLSSLFETALTLACSTRPQDCTTAAYLLRTLLTQPLLHNVATQITPTEIGPNKTIKNPTESGPDHEEQDLENITEAEDIGKTSETGIIPDLCKTTGIDIEVPGNSTGISGLIPDLCKSTKTGPNSQDPTKDHLNKGSNGKASRDEDSDGTMSSDSKTEKSDRYLAVLEVLVVQLKQQLDVARRSLIHAAATRPLYPTMHCIRCLLSDLDLRSLVDQHRWRPLVKDLLITSFDVAQVVSPVVSNSSPEGNVPRGPGLELDAVVAGGDDVTLMDEAAESLTTVNLMPEYLVVCCWRSIKECSLLLGQLTMTAPLVDPVGDALIGLLSVKQLHDIGQYFITQLLESRHRGAFELAYAGFVKMTERLWRCHIPEVQELPKIWLREIMSDIRSYDPNNRLCATRRSAGVPFYVQAIVSTEPTTSGRACFRELMGELLSLAQPANPDPHQEDTAQVHSLNVLRALYRDSRLGEDVFPFIAGGLTASILGYASQLWAIRNSATLLFSALMTRIFGVKRSKDEMSKKNCLTGRVFFHRFPTLFQFLLDQLKAATTNIGSGGVYQLHPGLYPVLMVLGRLYPSVVEGSNSTLNTSAFLPHIIRCASSPVYKTRIMAARAIRPLVGKDQIMLTVITMLNDLPTSTQEVTSQNAIHGLLLQLSELMETVGELPLAMASDLIQTLIQAAALRSWLLTRENPCLLTRKAYAQLCFTTISVSMNLSLSETPDMISLRTLLTKECMDQLSSCDLYPSTPGLSEYMQCLARNLLNASEMPEYASEPHKNVSESPTNAYSQNTNYAQSQESKEISMEANTIGPIVKLVIKILQSPMYEVRLEGLEFLESIFSKSNGGEEGNDEEEEEILWDGEGKRGYGLGKCHLGSVLNGVHLFQQLVTMAMDEWHPECLALILEVMSSHPLSQTLPWQNSSNQEFSQSQVMERLNACQSSASDDVRCAALILSAKVIPHLYTAASQGCTSSLASVKSWCNDLEMRCAIQESVYSRLSVAHSLHHNTHILLLDPHHLLGGAVYEVWTLLMRLLEDEDCEVRDTASLIVHRLALLEEKDLQAGSDVIPSQPVVATLALDVAVSHMVAVHGSHDWTGVVDWLLNWILKDIEPDWPAQEEKQVRLFDKGEMNTYRDEMAFVANATKHLKMFLKSTVSMEPVSESLLVELDMSPLASPKKVVEGKTPGFEMFKSPNAFAVINSLRSNNIREKMNSLLMEFRNNLRSVKKIEASTPFLATPAYQGALIGWCRHVMGVEGLVGVVRNEDEAESLIKHVKKVVLGKYKPDEAVGNIMINFDNDKGLLDCDI